jgi:NADH-quinone oxidoreductase subunit J
MDVLLFLTFAAIAVACAINLVVQRHPIASALSLIGVMGSLAVLYLLLGGEFIAAVQLIVYAGAIMVLFVFVIMLLNAGAERKPKKTVLAAVVGAPLLFTFLVLLSYLIARRLPPGEMAKFGGFTGGTAANVGRALFTEYLLPFEVTSILILIAILGAVVLARKEID